jgi:hypothetical protein
MSQRPDTHADSTGNSLDSTYADGLDDVVHPRLSRRSRLLRAGLLVALVLAVATGLVWRSVGGGTSANTTSHDSTRQSGVLIASNINAGIVTVNGQKQSGAPPVIVQLRSGKNTITFDAFPFAPASCVVVWPEATTSAEGSTCSLSTLRPSENVVVGGKPMAVGNEITFSIGGASLSPTECAHVLDAIVTSLNSLGLTTIVPAGQHIATGNVSQEQVPFDLSAPTGLYARLTPHVEDYADRRCDRLFAGAPQLSKPGAAGPTGIWNVFVPVTEDLSFVGLDGVYLGPSAATEGIVQMNLVVPSSDIVGWHLAVVAPTLDRQIEENLCESGSQVLAAIYHLTYSKENQANFSSHSSSRGSHGIEGCWLELDVAADNWETKANYLWRFGVLMATDTASHNLLPMLPIASAAELATVPLDR